MIGEGKLLRAGIGRFRADNLETLKVKWRCLDQMWDIVRNTAVFQQRSSGTKRARGVHDEGRALGSTGARSAVWDTGAMRQSHMMSMGIEMGRKTDIGVFAKEELRGHR